MWLNKILSKVLLGFLFAALLVTPAFAKSTRSNQDLPDLTIRHLRADYDGKYISVELDVLNKGKEYAKYYSLEVSVYDNEGKLVSRMGFVCAYPDSEVQRTCFMKPGESRHSGFEFGAYGLKSGKYKIVAITDVSNMVWESNENNNQRSVQLLIK